MENPYGQIFTKTVAGFSRGTGIASRLSDTIMDPLPTRPTAQPPTQPRWPVRLVSLLLLLQMGAIIGAFSYYIKRASLGIDLNDPSLVFENIEDIPQPLLDALMFGITFLPIVLVLVLASVGFLFLRRSSWMIAMILEGFTLFLCLSFYFNTDMRLIHPIMAYSVFIVLYLNSAGVRSVFRALNQPR